MAKRSVAASTTRSHPESALRSSVAVIRARAASASGCVSLPFATSRDRFFSMVLKPRSRAVCSTSANTTGKPPRAKTWAMPLPMVPAPTIPTRSIPTILMHSQKISFRKTYECSRSKRVSGSQRSASVPGIDSRLQHLRRPPHDERQRREAEDGDAENEEGILIAEHRGLAQHLLVGVGVGELRCRGRALAQTHQTRLGLGHVVAVDPAVRTDVAGQILLVHLAAACQKRCEQRSAQAATQVARKVRER